jgi:hypothetical protein
MKTYRIDNRKDIKILSPQDKYQSRLDEKKKSVEDLLERKRPKDKPERNKILMLFIDFKDALKHWTNQKGAIFYQTFIDENAVLHKGDYVIVEKIHAALNNNDITRAESLADDYWKGVLTQRPIIELFVNEALITKVISDSEKERINEKLKRTGMLEPDPKTRRVIEED